jgi:hypothetical protein
MLPIAGERQVECALTTRVFAAVDERHRGKQELDLSSR